jgi:hypothetical protein
MDYKSISFVGLIFERALFGTGTSVTELGAQRVRHSARSFSKESRRRGQEPSKKREGGEHPGCSLKVHFCSLKKHTLTFLLCNSSLFNEFVCKVSLF